MKQTKSERYTILDLNVILNEIDKNQKWLTPNKKEPNLADFRKQEAIESAKEFSDMILSGELYKELKKQKK